MRLRENAESVALYRGEAMELGVFQERFRSVFENFWQIMKRQKRLSWFTSGYAQIAVIFPVVVVAPRYFAKQIGLGGLMQVVSAFSAGAEFALVYHYLLHQHRGLAGRDRTIERFRGTAFGDSALDARAARARYPA